MLKSIFISILFIFLSSCSSKQNLNNQQMTVKNIIERAADRQAGIPVSITFSIASANEGYGRGKGKIFINSEKNYRNPKSLNINIEANIADRLRKKYSFQSAKELIGRNVTVKGIAKRIKIVSLNGKRYYYQTQILVKRIKQIDLL